MKLSTKVLLLALLNIGVLLLLFAGLLVTQYGGELKPMLIATSREKIDTVSRLLIRELEDLPPERWTPVFDRYSREYGITLVLLDREGNHLGGAKVPIPPIVLQRTKERPPPGLPGERKGPPPDRVGPPGERKGPPPAEGRLFVERTGGELTFWVGMRFRAPFYEVPAALLYASPGWLTSRFFFDGRPWLIAIGVILAVSALCWLPFIRGLTASVAQLSKATERIADGHFEIELPHARRDEIGQLGTSINALSGQLSRFVTGQKRFLADVAHELCSPIARIQFAAGILERRVSDVDREYVADLQAEIQHMSALVNELLSFTKMGLQPEQVKLEPVNLAQITQRAVEREGPSDARIVVAVDPTHAVLADPNLLLRAVSNLLRNALRYAGEAGPVTILSAPQGTHHSLTIADCGPGIPEALLGQVFEPFRRLDSARTRAASGGVGLGLAIVKSCVEACQGEIRCRNRQPTGLEVEIRLPAAPALKVGPPGPTTR
ncbi:MAG: HAMP domain-containing histidine kinase [Bryobacteraceae bacterium]|nr:HAMP domain-containing histidine kinase [Bryobacteraceae bacterium]